MASNLSSSLCCFPIGRKHRKCSKNSEIKLKEQNQQISRNNSRKSESESEIYESESEIYDNTCSPSNLDFVIPSKCISEHCMRCLDDKKKDRHIDIDLDKEPGIVREHSATLSSFDGVVSRISLSGSVSSNCDNVQDIDFESSEQQNNCPQDQDLYADTVNRQVDQSEIKEEHRISVVSYGSSGYGSFPGSMKENGRLSTDILTEVCNIPLDDNLESAGSFSFDEMANSVPIVAEENIGSLESYNAADETHIEMTTDNKKTDESEPEPMLRNTELSDILESIKEALERESLKPNDLTGMSVQLPNFSAKYLTKQGGKIAIPGTRISLYVPPDALNSAVEPILVYVYLNPRQGNSSELENDRKWLTPNVECGPHGLKFDRDVFLTMPHYAVNPESWEFDAHQTKPEDNTPRILRDAVFVNKYEVTMLLDHFCSHGCSGRSSSAGVQEVRKWMKAGVLFQRQDDEHTNMSVKLHDIDCFMHLQAETESFPINESANKVLVVVKGLASKWQLDEDPVKEIQAQDLWTCEIVPEVTFTARLRTKEPTCTDRPLVSCTLDVFQHQNDHPGATLKLQMKPLYARGAKEQSSPDPGNIQIKFLVHQEDLTPSCGNGISNHGFRKLCVLLENAEDCGKGWSAFAEKIEIIEYQYVSNIEKRAKWTQRSPAAIVLDFFFKENSNDPFDALKRLSNIFGKIDNLAAKELVDQEIQAIEDQPLSRISSPKAQDYQTLTHVNENHLIRNYKASPCSDVEGNHLTHLGKQSRKSSLRTSTLLASIQNRLGKFNMSSFKKTRKSDESNSGESVENFGRSNAAFEEELGNEPHGLEKPEENEQSHIEEIQEVDDGKRDNRSNPKIFINFIESTSTDFDPNHNSSPTMEHVDEIGKESNLYSLTHQGLTPDSIGKTDSDGKRPDSGISSIGSRDSLKSINSHVMTVCSESFEEEY